MYGKYDRNDSDDRFLDRMELISIAGYTENERFHIGKDYLIPKQLEKNGLQKKNLQILDGGLRAIISHYTKEAGVRELERQIGKVCRKCAKKNHGRRNGDNPRHF